MNRYMIAGAAALLAVGVSACTPRQIAIAKRAATHHAPARRAPVDEDPVTVCPAGELVILHGQAVDCDLRGGVNTLTEVWNGDTEPEGWGGDASLAAADAECAGHGGTPIWSGGVELRCTLEDF